MNDISSYFYKITQAFTLTLPEIVRLSEMAQRTGLSKSELVRRAINKLAQEILTSDEIKTDKEQ